MSITFHERPGVYSDYEASSGAPVGSTQKVVALIGLSAAQEGLYHVTSCEEALATFGAATELGGMVRAAYLNGAGKILAYSLQQGTASRYAAAFARVFQERSAAYCAIGSGEGSIHTAFKTALLDAAEQKGECIGIVGLAPDSTETPAQRAAELDCERMVLLTPSVYGTGETTAASCGILAAAFAGMLAAEEDPALPVNGVALKGFSGVTAAYGDTELDALVRAGVTVLECTDGAVRVVRAVTTKQTVGEGRDATFRELGVIRVIDDVIPAVRRAIAARFSRAKNNAQTRSAIRSCVIVELEDRVQREIIDGYEGVTVQAASEDATVCVVGFRFTVTHGLNRVHLTAQITV